MVTDVISATVGTDQEEVARLAARYNFLAIPIVDDGNHLVGIVTIDDVVDVIREEATEDILKMAGADETVYESPSVLQMCGHEHLGFLPLGLQGWPVYCRCV